MTFWHIIIWESSFRNLSVIKYSMISENAKRIALNRFKKSVVQIRLEGAKFWCNPKRGRKSFNNVSTRKAYSDLTIIQY